MAAKRPSLADMIDVGNIIIDLHDAGINGQISWFHDSSWLVALGDDLSGRNTEESFEKLGVAIEWLRAEAVRRYPGSEFAKKYGRGFV